MRIRTILITFCLAALVVITYLTAVDMAAAAGYESVGVKHAATHVREAKAALRDAERVLTATRHYQAAYGAPVARWVWLADSVGWPSSQWPTLFMVIDRESGGSPKARNPSGASGLLQLMPGWYAGDYYGKMPNFDPFNPRLNLKYGLWGWKEDGWIPWAL